MLWKIISTIALSLDFRGKKKTHLAHHFIKTNKHIAPRGGD